ncbi:hypothetical protein GIB67_022111, partial [Kingdonia uniflora]
MWWQGPCISRGLCLCLPKEYGELAIVVWNNQNFSIYIFISNRMIQLHKFLYEGCSDFLPGHYKLKTAGS